MNSAKFDIDEVVGIHQTVYDVYFSQADSTGSGAIGALDAGNFLKNSKLKADILKNIWELSDPTGKGYLDRQSFYTALKLIALSQSGQEVSLENISFPTPAPELGALSSNITSLISPDDPWYIKASSRINFDKIFDSLSPINDKITGARVKPFLMNSALPVDILGKIWELSDLDQDGNLDREEFLISMQLVTKAKEGSVLPDTLPPSLLPFKVRSSNLNSPLGSIGNIQPAFIMNELKPWVVTFEEKAKSDLLFSQLDVDKKGHVTGAEIKETLIKTGLSQMILANIWKLCDIGSTGKLNSEQFALAMHFVHKKLATGLDAPPELSPEMVPPTLRKKANNELTIESKELEELQLQVTELQREKLFYEQRATEHETQSRQKRTELSKLELEMESLTKTTQDREMKRVEEENRLADLIDRLTKINDEIEDLKQTLVGEKSEIDALKKDIAEMETSMRGRDSELNQVKSLVKKCTQEQTSLEIRLESRKNHNIEMNVNLQAATNEIEKNKKKLELLATLQGNLNKLLQEYEVQGTEAELTESIQKLEEENLELNKQIKEAIEASNNNLVFKTKPSMEFPSPASGVEKEASFGNNKEEAFNADFSNMNSTVEDPFQTYDPFKDTANSDPFKESSSDPFKDNNLDPDDPFASASLQQAGDPFASAPAAQADDPFATQASGFESDPFGAPTATKTTVAAADAFADDPFNAFIKKKEDKPVRPAPPQQQHRAQTPSLKPTKTTLLQQRPQSSMDFTKNNKLDLFSDFGSDPFQNVAQSPKPSDDVWGDSTGSAATKTTKTDDAWDPFG